jgi:hypothetical protein
LLKVLIVGGEGAKRHNIRALLDSVLEVGGVEEAATLVEAIGCVGKRETDVLIVDLATLNQGSAAVSATGMTLLTCDWLVMPIGDEADGFDAAELLRDSDLGVGLIRVMSAYGSRRRALSERQSPNSGSRSRANGLGSETEPHRVVLQDDGRSGRDYEWRIEEIS